MVQIIQINLVLKNGFAFAAFFFPGSNNTNKLSPQEHSPAWAPPVGSSNNTNKLSPQERDIIYMALRLSSNNTNKLSPQEQK